jgi:hypothetical protein
MALTTPIAFFLPAFRFISAISQTNPMVITTTVDHLFGNGLIVRLTIPPQYGMTQADGLSGTVTVLSSNTCSLNIDATLFSAFVVPSGLQQVQAQIIPYAEVAPILTQAERNVLPL